MIRKIISGGQTGVDRSALDFSLQNNIHCGGWCPKDRIAEDGIIDIKYPLKETTEKPPIYRTKLNIEDADGTLIIFSNKMDKGTSHTLNHVQEINSPVYLVDLAKPFSKHKFAEWICSNRIKTLNIAGPRESNSPGIYKQTLAFLENLKELF